MSGQRHGDNISDDQLDNNQDINFAVPTVTSLSDFAVGDFDIPSVTKPGIIHPIINTLSGLGSSEYMLCADGKKVTAGVDSKGGDVDMFGHEDGTPLAVKTQRLQNEKAAVNNINQTMKSYESDLPLSDIKVNDKIQMGNEIERAVAVVSSRLKDSRELSFRQELGMNKFRAMAGPSWRDSRYVYVISGLQASLFQLKEFKTETVTVVNTLLYIISCLHDPVSEYVLGKEVDQAYQQNMLSLPEEQNDQGAMKNPRFMKQRSNKWFEIRKTAKVTGSTIHSAIGLRGLKEQKKHFSVFVEGGVEDEVSDEVRKRLEHGTHHEKDAVATLVGKILPAFFPTCYFVEEGCYPIRGTAVDTLGIVSPDGSIREIGTPTLQDKEKTVAAVEIKCPFPSERTMPVHYKLPDYYVCQCLAEMHVLNTDLLIYMSYSASSCTVLKVKFSHELWETIMKEVKRLYDLDNPVKPTKSNPNVKDLKAQLKDFVENNVEFVCEVPSCALSDSGLRSAIEGSPYLHAWSKPFEAVKVWQANEDKICIFILKSQFKNLKIYLPTCIFTKPYFFTRKS